MTRPEYEKAVYESRKKANLCTKCGKQDAYTIYGKALCFECEKKARERQIKWYQANRDRQHDYRKRKREERKAAGLCPKCGKRRLEKGEKQCAYCRSRNRVYSERYQRKNGVNYPRGDNGFCYRCNKVPAMEGRRLCEKCYGKTLINLS